MASSVWEIEVRSALLPERVGNPSSSVRSFLREPTPYHSYVLTGPRWRVSLRPVDYCRSLIDSSGSGAMFSFGVDEWAGLYENTLLHIVARCDSWSAQTGFATPIVAPLLQPIAPRPAFAELDTVQLAALDDHFERMTPLVGTARDARREHLRRAASAFKKL